MKNQSFVILREAGGLGDVVRVLPVISGLKRKDSQSRITLVCLPQYRELFSRPGGPDEYVAVTAAERRPRNSTPDPMRYPYLREALGKDAEDVRVIDLYCPALRHEIETRGAVTRDRTRIFCDTAGLPVSTPCLPLFEKELAWADGWLEGRGLDRNRTVVLQPFSMAPERCWPPERWAELSLWLMARGLQALIADHRPSAIRDIPGSKMAGLPLMKAAAVLSRCRLLICPDSGLFHLAGAVGTPALGLFGPTRGDIMSEPYPRHRWIQGGLGTRVFPPGAPSGCRPPCYSRSERGFHRSFCRVRGCAAMLSIRVDEVGRTALETI